MRRIRMVGICLIATFAMSAVATAGASAAAPEYGKCIKTIGGKWKDAGCKTPSKPGEERYEWFKGFNGNGKNEIVKKAFKAHIKEIKAGAVTLEGVAGVKVQCSNESSTGEFTGEKTVKDEKIVFSGCLVEGAGKCENTATEGTVTVNNLVGELGVVKFGTTSAANKLGDLLKPKEGTVVTQFECAGSPTKVRGAVISPLATNAMKFTSTVKFAGTKGKQKPERFETSKGVKGPLEVLETAFLGSNAFEQSAQTMATIQENEGKEKVEASSVN